MFQMVRLGSVSGASHLSYAKFFFSFFFGPGSVQKRKDINLLPMRNKPKFSKKKNFQSSRLVEIEIFSQYLPNIFFSTYYKKTSSLNKFYQSNAYFYYYLQ